MHMLWPNHVQGSGLKTGKDFWGQVWKRVGKMAFFLSEIGPGFGDAGGTPPPKIPRGTPPPGAGTYYTDRSADHLSHAWVTFIYSLQTKCVVKMTGYWPSSVDKIAPPCLLAQCSIWFILTISHVKKSPPAWFSHGYTLRLFIYYIHIYKYHVNW